MATENRSLSGTLGQHAQSALRSMHVLTPGYNTSARSRGMFHELLIPTVPTQRPILLTGEQETTEAHRTGKEK